MRDFYVTQLPCDLDDLWVIKIKKYMILCAPGTSRSREQSSKCKSSSENMWKVILFYSQNNTIIWLSNVTECLVWRCVGCLFFLLFFLGADWLGRQTLITWYRVGTHPINSTSGASLCLLFHSFFPEISSQHSFWFSLIKYLNVSVIRWRPMLRYCQKAVSMFDHSYIIVR